MSSGGQISVNIALQGADTFDSSIDSVSSKLQTLQQNAGTTGTSLGGLGTNAGSASTGVNTLGTSSASTGTKMLAVGGAAASVAGSIIGLVGNYEDLARSGTTVERMNKNVETTTIAHEKAVDALNKIIKGGTTTEEDYSKVLDKVSSANKKIADDNQHILDDEAKISKLRAEGKTNTIEYSNALHKLGDDQATLKADTEKLGDAQKGYSALVQHHVDTTSPAYIEAVQRVKATEDASRVAKERAKEAQDALNLAHVRFYEQIAQTGLQVIGSLSTAISILTRGTGSAAQGMTALKTESAALGGGLGTGGILMIGLVAVGAILLAIATNFGGIRTALQQFASDIVAANPWLKPFVDLIGALADNLGLTGKGFLNNTGEIPKAIKEIYDQIKATPIGSALADISTAIQNFFKNPFGVVNPAAGGVQKAVAAGGGFLQPGVPGGETNFLKNDLGTLDPNAINKYPQMNAALVSASQGTTDTGTQLGMAIEKQIKAGFDYAITKLPTDITNLGNAINNALKAGIPSFDALGASVINGLNSAATGGKLDVPTKNILFQMIEGFQKNKAALDQAVGRIVMTAMDPANYPQINEARVKLGTAILNAITGALKGAITAASAEWDKFVKYLVDGWNNSFIGKAVAELAKIPTAVTAAATTIKTAWDTFVKALETAWKSTMDAIGSALQKIVSAINSFISSAQASWKAFVKALEDAWKSTMDAISSAIDKIATGINSFIKSAQAAWKTFTDAVGSAWKSAMDAISTALDKIATGINSFIRSAQAAWKTFTDALGTAWKTMMDAISTSIDKISGAINAFERSAKAAWDSFVGALKSAWDGLVSDILGGIQKIQSAITAAQQALQGLNRQPPSGVPGPGGGYNTPLPPIGQSYQQPAYGGPGQPVYYGGPPAGTFGWAAMYAPKAPVNTAPINVLVAIDGKNVMTSLKPYQLGGSGALT